MHQFSVIFTMFSIFFLSALAAPLPLGPSLNKRNTGEGTWFYDGLGACGAYDIDSDPIVAISAEIYGSGGYCGLWVSITNTANGQSAYGLVHDECQSCGASDLDMSEGLFEQLDDLSAGVLSIDWDFMPEGWSP